MEFIASQPQGRGKFTLCAFLKDENKHWIGADDLNALGYCVAKDAYYLIPKQAMKQGHKFYKDMFLFPIGENENVTQTLNRTSTYLPKEYNGFNERQLWIFRTESTKELYFLNEIDIPYFMSLFMDKARRNLIIKKGVE